MITKENDIVLNMLANPSFSITDFQTVGLTSENTSLLPEDKYLASERITDNEIFKTEGKFDKSKFHQYYLLAAQFYNDLSTQDYDKKIMENAVFSTSNIWADPKQRTKDNLPEFIQLNNPELVTNSLYEVGKKGPRTKSISEIAQAEQVYNIETGQWSDSPNESFFDNFFNTLVLATYEEDIFDEKTGEKIHSKGQYKLNENGLPYYETLGGRDVYGKQVLNKMNIITTDGSVANKFDFLDSDDIDQRSIAGSIIKNAALVAPMFLPGYAGAIIKGLSVATQFMGMMTALGKVFVGENETLNNIQGWAKSISRSSQTEYAAENTWCMENFLNLIGDTAGQLAEQRWIFKNVPYLLNPSKAKVLTKKGYESLKAEKLAELNKTTNVKDLFDDIIKNNPTNKELSGFSEFVQSVNLANQKKAIKYVDDLTEKMYGISSPISKAYMTGLVVQDTYGEAKAAGATDLEAALLTVGYAGAELALLSTDIGQWIMPELQGNKIKNKYIIDAITKDIAPMKQIANTSKHKWAQNIINAGKKAFNNSYAEHLLTGGKKSVGVITAHAMAESVEETSEELLADFSKSIFNGIKWLKGEETLDLGQWENIGDRYLMSALGGLFGGGIASVGTDFSMINSLSKMDKSQATQELIHIINNGEEEQFLKQLRKANIGDENLSAVDIVDVEGENVIWGEAKKGDNQSLAVKSIIANKVQFIKNILNTEGAKLSKESLLNKLIPKDRELILKELTLARLQNAQSLSVFTQEYLDLQNKLVSLHSQLKTIDNDKKDSEKETELTELKRKQLNAELEEVRTKIQSYIKGNMIPMATKVALFEMNPLLNNNFVKTTLPFFVKQKYHKSWNDLSDTEKAEAKKEFDAYRKTQMKNDVYVAANVFHDMLEQYIPQAQQISEYVTNLQNEEFQSIINLQNTLQETFQAMSNVDLTKVDVDSYLVLVDKALNSLWYNTNVDTAIPLVTGDLKQQYEEQLNKLQEISALEINEVYTKEDKEKDLTSTKINLAKIVRQAAVDVVDAQVQPFLKLGYINPEIKQALLQSLRLSKNFVIDLVNNIDNLETSFKSPAEESAFKDNLRNQYSNDIFTIQNYEKSIRKLPTSPIIEYLNQFLLNVTNSNLNFLQHWNNTNKLFKNNEEDLSLFTVDSSWSEDNQEALYLIDTFISVINGMKVDNAGFDNPTGYTKILNALSKKHKVPDYVELPELDSKTADLIIQDALLIKDRLTFAQVLSNANTGQKLRQQETVAINNNYILYNNCRHLVQVIPDDWIGKEELEIIVNQQETLEKYSKNWEQKLSREEKEQLQREIINIENAIYEFFNKNKESNGQLNIYKLETLLNNIAGINGFFERTGSLLTENSRAVDKNSFIWWLAARAAVKAQDFYGVYLKSMNETIAPIASQELATYLGVAAISNMPMLNIFVDAYRNTVIKEFNTLSEDERVKLLTTFDGSEGYPKAFLKYFGGHNVLPQYKNMIFIEGIPGTGKSFGVFTNVINVIRQLQPDLLNDALYVHANDESAKKANADTGLNSIPLGRVKFLEYVSSEWKDVRNNIRTEKDGTMEITGNFLYEDSYLINNEGQVVNKWKLNKYPNTPKVIFIDEITHYNQQELSMIEQFAKENGIVIITAGDMDQDTQIAYAKIDRKICDLTIHRNNFIRSQKLGVSLRTLNKQMTQAIAITQSAVEKVRNKEQTALYFNYIDNDSNHKGLFGVKVVHSDLNELSDSQLESIKESIQLMLETATEPIGYIYSDENSKLYQYITTNFSQDKIIPYKDSDAQGLEGQYYIVENKRNFGTTITQDNQESYIRSVHTGVSRSKQGTLLIAPQQFGYITEISCKLDAKFQLESITNEQKKRAYESRKEQLQNIILESDNIKIEPLQKEVVVYEDSQQQQIITIPDVVVDEIIEDGYSNKQKAIDELELFKTQLLTIGELSTLVVDFGENGEESIEEFFIEEKEKDGITYYIPSIKIDGAVFPLSDVKKVSIKSIVNNNSAQLFHSGEQVTLQDENSQSNYVITEVNNDSSNQIDYTITNLEDNSTKTISQEELQTQYAGPYAPTLENQQTNLVDNELENSSEGELEASLLQENITKEEIFHTSNHIDHLIYTFNTMEMGVKKDENGMPKFDGSEEKFNARIDNAIGLMHLPKFQNYKYDDLETVLAYLHGLATTIEDNSTLAKRVKSLLGLSGNTKIEFAFKSSAGRIDTTKYKQFDRYDIDTTSEELLHIHADGDKAKEPLRKKLVLLVSENGKTVFELSLGVLNSPLTVLQTEQDGKLLFEEEYKTFFDAYKKTKNVYSSMLEVIEQHANSNEELINLFKFWHFTSNGIFYLDESFNLASNTTNGPSITPRKGDSQLDQNLLFTNKVIDIEEFAKDKRFYISSVLSSKDGHVNNKPNAVNAGHSFVLYSDNPLFQNDQQLVDQFVKQLDPNYNGKYEVSIAYVIPPGVKVSKWIENQHNLYLKQQGNVSINVNNIGNDFTAYKIIKALIQAGDFDSLKSSNSTHNQVRESINKLDAVEQKWMTPKIKFNNNQEQALYESKVKSIGDMNARKYMMYREQKSLLNSNPQWNIVTGHSTIPTLAKHLSSYLTNIVWFKSPANPNPIYNSSTLEIIDKACEKVGLTSIRFKPQFSSENIGPFIKVVTKNKWELDTNANFKIHAKIDTRTFSVKNLSLEIKKFVENFTFDELAKVYKQDQQIKDTDEKKYLFGKVDKPKDDLLTQIQNEYKKYFESKELDIEALAIPNADKKTLLLNLAKKYNQVKGNYGFVYNNKLYLTKLDNKNVLINTDPEINNLNEVIIKGTDGKDYEAKLIFETDANGNIININSQETNLVTVSVNTFTTLSEEEFNILKSACTNTFTKFWKPAFIINSTNILDFTQKLEVEKTNKARLVTSLTKIIEGLTKKGEINAINLATKLLNSVNNIGNVDLNIDDVVQVSGVRYKIISLEPIQGIEINNNDEAIGELVSLETQNIKKEELQCASKKVMLI